ncbi:RNA polymerase sigma factor [candidate division WOR-3 bacterium]|nr:RNA polymerase sigma factor [candidate division WOR-3 bacterium]
MTERNNRINYNNLDSFSLYHLFKNGDAKAFESLYNRYSARIFNYLLKLLCNWDLAEDILEETFIKLFVSNLVENGKLKNWLFRVATNLSYKTLRKMRNEISDYKCILKEKHNPCIDVIRKVHIQKALMKVPETQRVVIILKFYQGMKYKEISEIIGCPLGTVKTRMHQGLKKMQKILKRFNHR